MGLLFALFSWGSGGGTYDDLGIPVSDFGVLIFFSFGEGSVAGLYTCQSHIQIVYITKSGHGIETHLRSNLAQLLEGYGLGNRNGHVSKLSTAVNGITYRRGSLFSSHIQVCVDISGG